MVNHGNGNGNGNGNGHGHGMDRMVDEAMMKHFTCTSSRTH